MRRAKVIFEAAILAAAAVAALYPLLFPTRTTSERGPAHQQSIFKSYTPGPTGTGQSHPKIKDLPYQGFDIH